MPDPDKYERDFSFEGFQSGNPTSSQPGIRIDDELETISAAIGGVVDALKDDRRSDGKLQNGSVALDSLSDGVLDALGKPPTDSQLSRKAASGANSDITDLNVLQTLAASPPVPDWLNRKVPYGPFTVNLGGLPPECLPGGGTVAAFAAIQGFADVKTTGQNNLSTFVTGVSGIARSRMSNPSPVGVFGAAMANTPDTETAQVFAFNSVVTSQR